jgi:hypothetical protein
MKSEKKRVRQTLRELRIGVVVSQNSAVEWGPMASIRSVNGGVPQTFIPNELTATSRIQGIDNFCSASKSSHDSTFVILSLLG